MQEALASRCGEAVTGAEEALACRYGKAVNDYTPPTMGSFSSDSKRLGLVPFTLSHYLNLLRLS